MAYKIDIEKGFKILKCISPPIIFVNGPIFIKKHILIKMFKDENYCILNTKDKSIEAIQKYLENRKNKNFNHNPLVIKANIEDPELISSIFSGEFHNFTYVYMFPNSSKNYRDNILAKIEDNKIDMLADQGDIVNKYKNLKKENGKENGKEMENLINKLTINMINKSKETYTQHLEFFDNRIFTILV